MDNQPQNVFKPLNNEKKCIIITGGCYNSEVINELSKNPQNTIVIL
jgi:hypothetical protein